MDELKQFIEQNRNLFDTSEPMDGHFDRFLQKDGTVIEKTIRLADAIPGFDDFDFSTREGFLRDFDTLERAVIKARNEVSEGITEAYGEHLSKKNGRMKK